MSAFSKFRRTLTGLLNTESVESNSGNFELAWVFHVQSNNMLLEHGWSNVAYSFQVLVFAIYNIMIIN
jgi:hypothetical protein